MELQSNTKLPLITREGSTTLICFNEKEVTIKDGERDVTMYTYDYTRVKYGASSADIVNAIIRSKYSQEAMEAIINNHLDDEESEAHATQFKEMQAWRATAKQIASEVADSL